MVRKDSEQLQVPGQQPERASEPKHPHSPVLNLRLAASDPLHPFQRALRTAIRYPQEQIHRQSVREQCPPLQREAQSEGLFHTLWTNFPVSRADRHGFSKAGVNLKSAEFRLKTQKRKQSLPLQNVS